MDSEAPLRAYILNGLREGKSGDEIRKFLHEFSRRQEEIFVSSNLAAAKRQKEKQENHGNQDPVQEKSAETKLKESASAFRRFGSNYA